MHEVNKKSVGKSAYYAFVQLMQRIELCVRPSELLRCSFMQYTTADKGHGERRMNRAKRCQRRNVQKRIKQNHLQV